MAKQILVLSSRRLLLLKHHSGQSGNLGEQLVGANQQQLRVISTWNQLCQQLGVTTAGRRFKSAAPLLAVETADPCRLEDLPIEVINRKKDSLDLSFEDHSAAFKSKTTWEVLRALMVFQVCGINVVVDNNEKLMKLGQTVLGKKLFALLMKQTFYGQFVAGEDTVGIAPVIDGMRSFGVKSILDYSVEEDITQEEAEEREMESCVSHASIEENEANFAGIRARGDKEFTENIQRYQAHKEFGDRRVGVTGARTFFYQGEATCERNTDIFLRCIETVATTTHTTGFAAIKLTALGRPQLLLQLSEVIARARKYHQEVTGAKGPVIEGHTDPETFEQGLKEAGVEVEKPAVQDWLENMDYDKKGLINLFDWGGLLDINILLQDMFKVPNLKTGRMEPLISALTDEEEEQFKNMLRRMHTVFQRAKDLDVRVMVDAEQTYFQPAISRLTLEMMKKYNTEKAIVFNTYQCYLKEAHRNLMDDLEQANRQDFFFGAKLVRGAYMEQERSRAEALKYADPINEDFDATSAMYHKCLTECMSRIRDMKQQGEAKEKRVGIMVASHNEDTIRFAIKMMEELNIKPEDKVICFGQLLGMCDQLSFPLGQAGYSVYKYVPYGPVNEVLPYLSRRAHENKGILVKLQKEKKLLRRELKDRLLSGKLLHRPKGDYIPI
eukprot:TRINITY_DN10726_c0_g1_i1.p1 TRINITY_DN10726_c0_g1~~TRINITY_DN10726_c0_g1_i1.p1  ORF type:complete len:667 (-),score=208.06 TRINITY_DN10726_c0_g1_i1:229-2229(-)